MFDGDSFKKIKRAKFDDIPYRDKLTAVWFELLDLAAKCNQDGKLINKDLIAYNTFEDIAALIDRDTKEVELCLAFFQNDKMIEIADDIYAITNWDIYQNTVGLDKIREDTKNRVQNYRERQKNEGSKLLQCESNAFVTRYKRVTSRYSNVTVTRQNKNKNIDKDIDIDSYNQSVCQSINQSVNQSERQTDGQTDGLIEKPSREEAFYLDCIQSRITEILKSEIGFASICRLKQIIQNLPDKIKINGGYVTRSEYYQRAFDLLRTAPKDADNRLSEAFCRIDNASDIKNKSAYTLAALYNLSDGT
jgi:predicted phage replisome organizer